MRKNSSQLIIGVENREVEFVQNDYKIVDSIGECLGLILRKNRMVKGGVIKTWILAISEFFTTP